MMNWFLNLIGRGNDLGDAVGEAQLSLQQPVVLWAGLILLVPLAWWVYRRQCVNLPSASTRLRFALTGTRVGVAALLVLVLAGPYLKAERETEQKPILALLLDQSESMGLPVGPFTGEKATSQAALAIGKSGQVDVETRKYLNLLTRSELARAMIQNQSKTVLEPLAKKYEVRLYGFSRETKQITFDPADPQVPEFKKPGGPATHLGDALAHVVNEAAGRQLAGIALFSDGQGTGGRSPAEAAQMAAGSETPIFPVPLGPPDRLVDVAIVDVFTSGLISVGDTARVAVTLESHGLDKRPVKIELRDGNQMLDSKDLTLRGNERQQVELTYKAEKPGAKYLTVQVPPLAEEPEFLRSNNSDTAFVRVSKEKLRVLYLEGLPRWDFRFLKNAMRRDHGLAGRTGTGGPDIVLEAEWRRWQPGQQAGALPRTLNQLAEYHVVVLGDVSPQLLNPEFMVLLDRAVREKGVGLIVAAGPLAMPHAFADRLGPLLPVRMRPKTAGMEAPAYKPFRLEMTPEGAIHDALRFYDDPGQNAAAWGFLPPCYWCAAVERAAPAASVLVWNASVQGGYGKMPLIAHHYAGQGKVMFVGTDSTWLWRQIVGDRFFYRFWGQSIRFVARHDQAAIKTSWLEIRPFRTQPGEEVQIELMAFDGAGAPRTQATQPLSVHSAGTVTPLEATADPAVKGRYLARYVVPGPGEYRVQYSPGGGAMTEGMVEATIRALPASEELRQPNLNRPVLDSLASASGGIVLDGLDLAAIRDRLKGEPRQLHVSREVTLWDNWLMLVLLLSLYSLDTGLRRLAGLA